MSDNVLKKLAADMRELEQLFAEVEGLNKSAAFKDLEIENAMLKKHTPSGEWFKDGLKDLAKPHDREKLQSDLSKLAVNEDEEDAQGHRNQIVDFIESWKQNNLFNLTAEFNDAFRLIFATLKSVNEDIHSHNFKDMVAKLRILKNKLEETNDTSVRMTEKAFKHLDSFASSVEALKGN